MKRLLIFISLIAIYAISAHAQYGNTCKADSAAIAVCPIDSCEIIAPCPETTCGCNANTVYAGIGSFTNGSPSAAPEFDYKKTKYWGRYTALRAAGWTSFGLGVTCLLGGMFVGVIEAQTAANGNVVAGPIMVYSSLVLLPASIPLLICAYHNRHKAKEMSLRLEASRINTPKLTSRLFATPAIGLSLNF